MNNNLLKRKDFASLCGVSVDTLRRWEREGKIKPIGFISNRPLYSKDQFTQVFKETKQK